MLRAQEKSILYVSDIHFLILEQNSGTPNGMSLQSTIGKAANCSNSILHLDFPITQKNKFIPQ